MTDNYLNDIQFDVAQTDINKRSQHAPKILMLYGSLRDRSFSRLAAEEAGRILESMGAEVRFYNPKGLPLFDGNESAGHPKVKELRELVIWSEGMVWSSPEIHGNMSGAMKTQVDWIPLSSGAVRPTQGKTLAVMQVSGGSQSFNAINSLRVLGRWMRMLTIPNQSSVAKAYNEFHEDGTMKASPYRDRIVDVMEELMRFTHLTRDQSEFLVDRYSERKAQGYYEEKVAQVPGLLYSTPHEATPQSHETATNNNSCKSTDNSPTSSSRTRGSIAGKTSRCC